MLLVDIIQRRASGLRLDGRGTCTTAIWSPSKYGVEGGADQGLQWMALPSIKGRFEGSLDAQPVQRWARG